MLQTPRQLRPQQHKHQQGCMLAAALQPLSVLHCTPCKATARLKSPSCTMADAALHHRRKATAFIPSYDSRQAKADSVHSLYELLCCMRGVVLVIHNTGTQTLMHHPLGMSTGAACIQQAAACQSTFIQHNNTSIQGTPQ